MSKFDSVPISNYIALINIKLRCAIATNDLAEIIRIKSLADEVMDYILSNQPPPER